MLKEWQAANLLLFLRKKLIYQARIEMLKSWKHSGFSIDSDTKLLSKSEREDLGQYVVRGGTCAEKIHYDPDTDTVIWTASPKGFYKGRSETYTGFEFVDQLVAHLPPRRVQSLRRYGVYAGKVRNQWQRRKGIYRLAPEAWKQAHPPQATATQETRQEPVETPEAPDAWSKIRRHSWAGLLQKVYEVDPFICSKCKGTMSVVAVFEDPAELTKIIDWAKKHQRKPLLSVCARSPPEPALVSE